MLYLEYSTDRPKLSHSRFLEAAGDGLVNFNTDDWPSMTGPIPRAGDLPLDERADRDRTINPRPARRHVSDDTSEDEEMVDEPDVPRSPLLMPPPATPAATSTPAAAPQDVPAAAPQDVPAAAPDADLPVPDPPGDERAATFRPSQRISDPVCHLHRGDHTLVNIAGGGAKQKRCRVCHKNGRRRDTSFMCCKCQVPLCRVDAECSRKYHSMAVCWSAPPRGTVRGPTRRPQ